MFSIPLGHSFGSPCVHLGSGARGGSVRARRFVTRWADHRGPAEPGSAIPLADSVVRMSSSSLPPQIQEAFDWSVRIEAASAPLPRGWIRHKVRANGRLGFRSRLRPEDLPGDGGLFTEPVSGRSLLDGAQHTGRTRSAAELTLLGQLRHTHIRFRSFYLQPPRRSGAAMLTSAVQERTQAEVPGQLARGAQLVREVGPRLPLVVPRVIDIGTVTAPPKQVDYVVEEGLDGRVVPVAEGPEVLPELLAGIRELWALKPTTVASVDAELEARMRTGMATLAEQGPGLDLWPSDLDPAEVHARARTLLDRDPLVTSGLSHGDPGIGNLLRLRDGRIALVDWEEAGTRPLSHDVFKALTSSGVPVQDWSALHPVLPRQASRQAPEAEQLAIAVLGFLAGWRHRTKRARRRGGGGLGDRNRVHRLLNALDTLLS